MKTAFISVIGLVVFMVVASACNNNYLQYDEIDTSFEQDYVLISAVTEYMVGLEETTAYIDCDSNEMTGRFGNPLEFNSVEIKQIVENLAQKGYCCVTKTDNCVIFDIWRKPFRAEFESGFAYSIDGSGNLSAALLYQIDQRALSRGNWYYYESDYNEWRIKGDYVWENPSAE